MTVDEAARYLREMYNDPATGKAVSVHLFGIRYADMIRGMDYKDVAERAGIPTSYSVEINKGVNLAQYVQEK